MDHILPFPTGLGIWEYYTSGTNKTFLWEFPENHEECFLDIDSNYLIDNKWLYIHIVTTIPRL